MRKTFESIRRNPAYPAPMALSRLMRVARAVPGDELATLIDVDPRATATVLGVHQLIVGGASINDSLSDAVGSLGSEVVRALVLAGQMYDATRGICCRGFSHDSLLAEAAARAAAALIISRRLPDADGGMAVVCGVISEIGRVILASVYPDAYGYTLNLVNMTSGARTTEIEREVFDIDHHQLAAEVIADWGLPVVLRDAVLTYDRPRARGGHGRHWLTAVLELAAGIGKVIMRTRGDRADLDALTRCCMELDLGHEAVGALFDSTLIIWPSMASLLDAPTHDVARWPAVLDDVARA